jgi:hypothetical protein
MTVTGAPLTAFVISGATELPDVFFQFAFTNTPGAKLHCFDYNQLHRASK